MKTRGGNCKTTEYTEVRKKQLVARGPGTGPSCHFHIGNNCLKTTRLMRAAELVRAHLPVLELSRFSMFKVRPKDNVVFESCGRRERGGGWECSRNSYFILRVSHISVFKRRRQAVNLNVAVGFYIIPLRQKKQEGYYSTAIFRFTGFKIKKPVNPVESCNLV